MTTIKRPINIHKAFHAHVYFDENTVATARQLAEQIAEICNLKVGRIHEQLVGPHPYWSFQVTFGTRDFEQFLSWLDENRQDLTVLVHALTGNDLNDHTIYAYWLGKAVDLNLDVFKEAKAL